MLYFRSCKGGDDARDAVRRAAEAAGGRNARLSPTRTPRLPPSRLLCPPGRVRWPQLLLGASPRIFEFAFCFSLVAGLNLMKLWMMHGAGTIWLHPSVFLWLFFSPIKSLFFVLGICSPKDATSPFHNKCCQVKMQAELLSAFQPISIYKRLNFCSSFHFCCLELKKFHLKP